MQRYRIATGLAAIALVGALGLLLFLASWGGFYQGETRQASLPSLSVRTKG